MKKTLCFAMMAAAGLVSGNALANVDAGSFMDGAEEAAFFDFWSIKGKPLAFSKRLSNTYVALDMMEGEIILVNADNDFMIQQNLTGLWGWPGGRPQHAIISADGKWIYVTTDASAEDPASVVVLKARRLFWEQGYADLEVVKVLEAEPAGTTSKYNVPTQTSDLQPIASWTQPPMTQIHGPTILPYSNFAYFTQWTDDKVRIIDGKNLEFADHDPLVIEGVTDYTHGIFFNESGTLGLSTGYYYDDTDVDLYSVDKKTGKLTLEKVIPLGDENAKAAFTHFNVWLDERYVVTASMQFGPTSLTPAGQDIIPPSVWVIDAWEGTAKKILDAANDASESGVFRSASDIAVAAGKLYVAEEDSLDGTYGNDGYVSIYDLSNVNEPKFIKRLKPGVELPEGFNVSHSLGVTADERFIYLTSYASRFIIKIDTTTDTVVKVYDENDGLTMPHGGFVSGSLR
ncbi:hypothetical protein OE749_07840 [Aestuariibacter sp. AA17]|uniref:Methanethiol oxidase n=1 Tax=Fluctibacter corallii TaxID=2984329 RepID=A0ABT3A7F5_9ALTE|nr:hypothetical protein [Aestuariibacter sp. AA17]MCV2884603.1 hypothetical protein [Aestuariibacter sp. AA17]